MKKTAIFGGAFDPAHLGHMTLARRVFDKFRLDELVFMPAKNPPHKSFLSASPLRRFDMLCIAAESLGQGFSVSDMEINSKGVSYTYDTISRWRKLRSVEELFFIAGSDIFATIETWRNWEELLKSVSFIVVNRPGASFKNMFSKITADISSLAITAEEYLSGKRGRIILFEMEELDISSTEIRENISYNRSFLPEGVLSYIEKYHLYKEDK